MGTRRALQEIAVSYLESQKDDLMEEKEGAPLSQNKLLTSTSRSSNRYAPDDEHKENMSPAGCENFTKEKYTCLKTGPESSKEPERDARSSTCDQVRSCSSLEDSRVSHSKSSLGQQVDDETVNPDPRDGNYATPKRDIQVTDLPDDPGHTPMDFSKATAADFGISPESFTNRCAGKSPKSQLKYRRRSTIGVRGSPEMNFLIRQIAQQRSKAKIEPDLSANPFTSPRNFFLKNKMSAFRNAFQAVEENEGNIPFAGFSDETESRSNSGGVKAEGFEPPEKRKKTCNDVDLMTFSGPTKQRDQSLASQTPGNTEESHTILTCEETLTESECSLASGPSPSVSVSSAELQPAPLSSKPRLKRKVMFADLLSPGSSSPPKQLPEIEDPFATYPCPKPFIRPALKKTPRRAINPMVRFAVGELEEENDLLPSTAEHSSDHDGNVHFRFSRLECAKDSVKKKRVTFGRALSPELFDKTLPADTPLRRGSTPYNHRTPGNMTPGAAKATVQSPFESLLQPDFDNAEETIQPLSLCFDEETFSCDTTSSDSLPGHKDEIPGEKADGIKLSTPQTSSSLDDFLPQSSPERSPAEPPKDAQSPTGAEAELLLSENTESVMQESTSVPCSWQHKPSPPGNGQTVHQEDAQNPADTVVSTPESGSLVRGSRVTRSALKREFCVSEESTMSNGSQSEHQGKAAKVKRVSKKGADRRPVAARKAQIKAIRGKGKKTRGRPKKSVQKVQHEPLQAVSKKPLLSPIPELPECCPTPPVFAAWNFTSGTTVTPTRKQIVKVPKAKSIRKVQGKVQRNTDDFGLQEPGDDCVKKEEEPNILNVSLMETAHTANGTLDGKVVDQHKHDHINTPLIQAEPSQDTMSILDAVQQIAGQSNKVSQNPEGPVGEELGRISMPIVVGTVATSPGTKVGKTSSINSRRRSKRQSVSCNIEPKQTLLEEEVTAVNVAGLDGLHGSQTTAGNADDPQPVHTVQSTQKQAPTQSFPSTVLSLKPIVVGKSVTHQMTTTCTVLDEGLENGGISHSAVSPSAGQIAALMDNPLQFGAKNGKKVRRSMRLRRESDANGLSWVQEDNRKEVKGRRSVSFSVARQTESPKWLVEDKVNSPIKEDQKTPAAPNVEKKSRRRTLCMSALRETTALPKTLRRRSDCSKQE
ncbi:cell division cycle-associated protein 2 [Spea bombifrons]|uniref:cell division cycle-associated protein 2 n=1 Tax=Spea bombifrons TaxID=233779 RepID=UPI00234A89BA|nr:cell division cycle-associated protein 2 [Spea bombifrons]